MIKSRRARSTPRFKYFAETKSSQTYRSKRSIDPARRPVLAQTGFSEPSARRWTISLIARKRSTGEGKELS
jgi:hypothetical protein